MPTGELRAATLDEQSQFTMDVRSLPQVGRPPGDAQQRWTSYFLIQGWLFDDITEGTSTVDPLLIGIFVNGVHTDKEAMAWAAKNGRPQLFQARDVAQAATAPPNNGQPRREIVRVVNAYWGNTSRALDDPWSDAATEMISGAVVGVVGVAGVNIFRAGTTQGWAQLFVQAPVRQQIANVTRGAAASRTAARGSRQFLPRVSPAMAKNGVTEETLIRAAVNKTTVEWALRTQIRDAYLRLAWANTALATGGQMASIWDNAIFSAENDMADLDAVAIAEADRELALATEEAEQPRGFIEEAEAIWGDPLKRDPEGDPGRGIRTYPPGPQGLQVDGEPILTSEGVPVVVQITGNETPAEIAALLNAAGITGLQDDDPLIGVPPGGFNAEVSLEDKLYDANRTTGVGVYDDVAGMSDYAIRHADPVFVQADYKFSDRNHVLFNMTPPQVEAFQNQAIDAGLINPDIAGFALGSRGQQTIDAMETTMVYANNMGRDWRGAVEQLASEWQGKLRAIEAEKDRENQRLYSPQPFMALDTAFTAQTVKEDIRKRLGREPNQAELQMLQGYIQSQYRTAYEENERVLRADYAAEGRAIEDKTEQDAVSGVQVDWGARFAEEFEDRYASELDRKKRTEQAASKRGNLMASFRLGQNI